MRKTAIAMMLGLALAFPAAAQDSGAPATAPAATPPSAEEIEQALTEFRDLVNRIETEFVQQNLSLSAEEAAAFWPVFQRFLDEKSPIIDEQIEAVRAYAAAYATLDDAASTAYVQSLLERDQKIHEVRVKYLAEFAKVLPAGKAARVIQISRRVGLAGQAKLATRIPLVR